MISENIYFCCIFLKNVINFFVALYKCYLRKIKWHMTIKNIMYKSKLLLSFYENCEQDKLSELSIFALIIFLLFSLFSLQRRAWRSSFEIHRHWRLS